MVVTPTHYVIEFSSGNVGVIVAQAGFGEVLIFLLLMFMAALGLVMVVRLWTLSLQFSSLFSSVHYLQTLLSDLPERLGEVLNERIDGGSQ